MATAGSFTMTLQKPIGDITETTSIFYTVYGVVLARAQEVGGYYYY